MATIFQTDCLAEAWYLAAEYLDGQPNRSAYNIVLEIGAPARVTQQCRAVVRAVDSALRAHNAVPVSTAANTIFPQSVYTRLGADKMYERFPEILRKGREKGSWGTYAERLMGQRTDHNGDNYRPLARVVDRLRSGSKGVGHVSAYEMSVVDSDLDLTDQPVLVDVPTYNADCDSKKYEGFACLSHLSFKLVEKKRVNLVAFYRSHYYVDRALGNLIGLAQLLNFATAETGLQPGSLTCFSSYAKLDANTVGGIKNVKTLLSQCKDILQMHPAGAAPVG